MNVLCNVWKDCQSMINSTVRSMNQLLLK